MRAALFILGALLSLSPAAAGQPGGTLTVAAASDLQSVLPGLVSAFEKTTGVHATVSFGSSGNFSAQIQNGAPFDVFLSADADYPRRLAAAGQIDTTTLYEYAVGRLVIWTRTDSGVDIMKGLAVLLDSRVQRIAIANPSVAPYGRAAVAALQQDRLYDAVKPKLILAENVTQAAQFAESGNAQVALIGHSVAVAPALRQAGRFVDIPANLHPPILQAAGVVSASRHPKEARAFVEYLKTAAAKRVLETFGFEVPPPR